MPIDSDENAPVGPARLIWGGSGLPLSPAAVAAGALTVEVRKERGGRVGCRHVRTSKMCVAGCGGLYIAIYVRNAVGTAGGVMSRLLE